jgi:hypothetical protein
VISRIFVLITLAAMLAACGSSSSSAAVLPSLALPASASGSNPSGEAASPSTSAADIPSDAAGSAEPSVDAHGVPELEALLPEKVGGVSLIRSSLTGKDFHATGSAATKVRLDTFLGKLGKTVSDLRVGDAGDPTGATVLEIGAFQVVGADPTRLLAEWVASTEAADPGQVRVSTTTIDGRALTKLVDKSRDVGGTIYTYAKGDTLFLISADDAALVSGALAQLPRP